MSTTDGSIDRKRSVAFKRVLQDIMKSRGIQSQQQLANRIKRAGHPNQKITQQHISVWMQGRKAQERQDLSYWLEKALNLTEEEKESLAVAWFWREDPRARAEPSSSPRDKSATQAS